MKKAVLIMAGGLGERLWPLSREKKPKQFLSIADSKSLIEDTISRASLITGEENIFIITGKRYEESFSRYIPNFRKENIIYEPSGRDTAAAIAFGALSVHKKIKDAAIAIIPADPIIKDEYIFKDTIDKSLNIANDKKIAVIVGIKPTRPETGYGYIKVGDTLEKGVYKVDRFVEKPDLENAKKFLEDGIYLWNSGMFIWDIDSLLKTIENLMSDMYKKVVDCLGKIEEKDETASLKIYDSIEKKSFDVGIMEKLLDTECVEGNFFWDDLGAFSALSRICERDESENVVIGNAYIKEGKNNIVVNDKNVFIATSGVSNLTIVQSDGVFLIYPNGEDKRIKDLLKDIRNKDDLKNERNLL